MDLNWTKVAARTCALAALALLVLLVGATAPSSKAAATGLVAQYSFDEGSGTAVADSSGSGNNGTIQNGTWSTAGKYGGALQFNGSSTLVSIPDAASLDLTTGMTLEAWVNASTVSGWKNVLFKQQAKGMVYSLYAAAGNNAATAQVNIGGEQNAVNPTAMPANTWTFLSATYNGSNLKLYANGSLVTTVAIAGAIPVSTGALTIGGNTVWSEWFQGLIDNVRVYNRALTIAEIQTDMGAAAGGNPAPPTNPPPTSQAPVAAYSFDEGSGTTLTDTSGNGNNGTVQNATWTTSGKYGGALQFNGTSSTVVIPDKASLDLTSGMTLEAWLNPTTVNAERSMLAKAQGAGPAYGLYGSDGTGYSNTQLTLSGSAKTVTDPYVTPTNQWNYLAATYDGANVKLYGNGVLVKTVAMTGPISTNNNALTLGGNSALAEWFQGQLDNIRVYNRALSASEVQSDMNTPVPAASNPTPPPTGDTQAPTVPANVVASGATQTGLTLTWNASSDNTGVTGYSVYRNGASVGSTASGTRTFTFSGLTCGTTYTLSVDAYDAAGNHSAQASQQAATSACPQSNGNVFVSRSGSDSNGCTQSAPCATFDRAYKVAQPGQTVEVAAGSYGGQTINVDGSKTSASDVLFRPAAGASVTLGGINIYGAHVAFQDFTINGDWQAYHSADDVTFRNVTVNGGFYTQSASNISVIGGSVGGLQDTKPQIGVWPENTVNKNILIDGVYFHDMTRSSDSVHTECLLIGGAQGLTVRNSRFHNCAVFALSIGAMNGTNSSDITVENNMFEAANSGGYYSLFLNDEPGTVSNVLIRNNSSPQEMYFSYGTPTLTNFQVVGNASPMSPWACNSKISYTSNVWQGAQCGSSDLNVSALGFKSATDMHLAAGSPAINHGAPGNYPSTDIDGQARPMGGAPDAGADEAS